MVVTMMMVVTAIMMMVRNVTVTMMVAMIAKLVLVYMMRDEVSQATSNDFQMFECKQITYTSFISFHTLRVGVEPLY